MTFLLDVNVLIALIDPGHVSHDAAHGWFEHEGHKSWATCPITENGLIRIVSHPGYPNNPGTPGIVAEIMRQFRTLPGHVFWADTISLLDTTHVDAAKMLTPRQVTDTYLAALAAWHGGRLASFDRRLSTSAVAGGGKVLHLIGPAG